VSSSPRSKDRLDEATIWKIVDDALSHPDVEEIGLTGGEPLLRKELALSIIRKASGGGLRVTCVTNGYWGATPLSARKMFDDLEAAGLHSLTVSYDEFHAEYIGVDRIRNVLDASKESSIKTILNMAVSRSKTSSGLIEALGTSAHCIPLTRFPVLPAGEANKLPDSDFERAPITPQNTKCPGFEIIFHHNGRVYPCCSPSVFGSSLVLATAADHTIEELTSKVERNAILSIIQREGLGWFQDKISQRLPESAISRVKSIVSVCELCSIVFGNPDYIDAIKEDIFDYFSKLAS